jgi:hypothetical protein
VTKTSVGVLPRIEERFDDRFSRAFVKRNIPKLTKSLRKHGHLDPHEDLEAIALLSKRSPSVAWFVSVALEAYAWILVTPTCVLVSDWGPSSYPALPKGGEILSLERPVRLELSNPPKRSRVVTRNRVELPEAIAAFLHRQTVYVVQDLVAADAFRIAGTPGVQSTRPMHRPPIAQAELVHAGTPDSK